MARSKSDISNAALRMFLQKIGTYYDEQRGFTPFKLSKKNKEILNQKFRNRCCYCDKSLTLKTNCFDHIVPLNKEKLGLHAWGNVIPSCLECNKKKHNKDWQKFLKEVAPVSQFAVRRAKIRSFIKFYKYDSISADKEIEKIAKNLYQDVGEISDKLIELRLLQAQEEISLSFNKK